MAASQPSSEDLVAALKEVKSKNPDFGVKRLLSSIKEIHQWEVSEKRIKKALQELSPPENGEAAQENGGPSGAHDFACTSTPCAERAVEWVSCARFSPRGYFTATHTEGRRAVIFGGEYYDNKKNIFYNDVVEIDVATESFRVPSFGPSHNLPPSRSAHQACVWGGWLYVFGGESSSPNGQKFKLHNDLWRMNISSPRWERIQAAGGPSGRSGHRMTLVGDKIVLYGGMGDDRYFQDLHLFDLNENKWLPKIVELAAAKNKSGPTPGPRSGFVMFSDGDSKAYVWGGTRQKGRGTETLSDMWMLDVKTLMWSKVMAAGPAPSPRSGAGVCVLQGKAYMCGGVEDTEDGQGKMLQDVVTFELATCTWMAVCLPSKCFGGRRNAACVCLDKSTICVIGGLCEEGKGKQEKERTLDDVWVAQVGEVGEMAAWRCCLGLSGEGDVWHAEGDSEDEGSDSSCDADGK